VAVPVPTHSGSTVEPVGVERRPRDQLGHLVGQRGEHGYFFS